MHTCMCLWFNKKNFFKLFTDRWSDGGKGVEGHNLTYPTCGDDRVLEDITAELAAQFYWWLFSKHLRFLHTNTNLLICLVFSVVSVPKLYCNIVYVRMHVFMNVVVSICLCLQSYMWYCIRHVYAGHDTVSSSSSCREKVERRDMLDSEWRDRTEMAESDLRGVPMGGWGDTRRQWKEDVIAYSYIDSTIVHSDVWDLVHKLHNRNTFLVGFFSFFLFNHQADLKLLALGNYYKCLWVFKFIRLDCKNIKCKRFVYVPFHRHHPGGSRLGCWRRREFFYAACRCWTLLLKTYKGRFTRKNARIM